jgi:hypothetical protein
MVASPDDAVVDLKDSDMGEVDTGSVIAPEPSTVGFGNENMFEPTAVVTNAVVATFVLLSPADWVVAVAAPRAGLARLVMSVLAPFKANVASAASKARNSACTVVAGPVAGR